MAQKRMFSKKITETDKFLEMSASAQALYFHLNMNADDDGFVDSPKKIKRNVGASDDDMNILLFKKFIIAFESGIIVIKDWKINNYIQADRYTETIYKDEKSQLDIDKNKSYVKLDTECIQDVYTDKNRLVLDKSSIDKIRVEENSIEESTLSTKVDVDLQEFIKNSIDYLNFKTNKNYKTNATPTIKCLKVLFKNKVTIDDIKKVIDLKCYEWLNDTQMKQYLRPATLFGNKFETYLEDVNNGNYKVDQQQATNEMLKLLEDVEW